jgi:cell division transport system permease protein
MKKTPDADAAPRRRPAALLPREAAQDLLLVFVTGVLCFFACLAVICALAADRAAGGWTDQLKDSATVLIRPVGDESADTAAGRAAATLGGVKGVAEARVLEKAKAEKLVEPWLGPAAQAPELPLPRLVTVQFEPRTASGAPNPTAAQLAAALKAAGIDGVVDDHSRWIGDIVRTGALARWAAIAAAVLIALSASAVIAFATRAGLAARHEIVEVLHLAGAEDRTIIRLFQDRLAELAAVAGLLGGAAAALVAAAARLMGGADGLTPVLPIAWSDLLTGLACPLIAAAIAAVAARVTAARLIGGLP